MKNRRKERDEGWQRREKGRKRREEEPKLCVAGDLSQAGK